MSSKPKHATTTWPSNYTPGHLSQRHEGFLLYKNLYTNVFNHVTCSCQKLETIYILQQVNGYITGVCVLYKKLFSNQTEWNIDTRDYFKNFPENYAEWKEKS